MNGEAGLVQWRRPKCVTFLTGGTFGGTFIWLICASPVFSRLPGVHVNSSFCQQYMNNGPSRPVFVFYPSPYPSLSLARGGTLWTHVYASARHFWIDLSICRQMPAARDRRLSSAPIRKAAKARNISLTKNDVMSACVKHQSLATSPAIAQRALSRYSPLMSTC